MGCWLIHRALGEMHLGAQGALSGPGGHEAQTPPPQTHTQQCAHPWAGLCSLLPLLPFFRHGDLQLENLVYYNRLKNSKIVISDFHLAKLENGLIKEPCGTPEYLGKKQRGGHRGAFGKGQQGTD